MTGKGPVRVKRHSQFVGGWTVTVLGLHWSRTWGVLPKDEQMFADFPYAWTGGMSWKIRTNQTDRHTLKRPTLALCKWRYR